MGYFKMCLKRRIPILHTRPQAESGVWGLFTEGLGKNIYTTPDIGGRNDILFKHSVHIR